MRSPPGTSTPSSSACRGCCPGWTSGAPTWSACRRRSSPTTPSATCSTTSSRARLRGRRARRGDLERGRDPVARRAGRRGGRARRRARLPAPEARAVSATCGGIRVVSVYVPNGRVPGSEHYEYKLAWLAALRDVMAPGPESTIVCGDMNIAPTDDDVFDPDAYVGETHVTAPERAALAELQASACATSCATAGPASGSSPTGTTGPGCSTRTSGCGSTWCWRASRSPTASRRRGSTGRPARAAGRATTRR